MKVKFKKLSENAVMPAKGSAHAAGFDPVVTSMEELDLYHTGYWFGLSVEIPKGYVGLVSRGPQYISTGCCYPIVWV